YPSLALGFLHSARHPMHTIPVASHGQQTLALTDSLPVFSAVGTRRQITDLLRAMPASVFSKHARSATSNIIVELHRAQPVVMLGALPRASTFIARVVRAIADIARFWHPLIARMLFSQQRRLIVRSECSASPMDACPLVSIRVPQGTMLSEVAALLEHSNTNASIDVTRDKALNIRVMGRSRSLSWFEHDGSDNDDEPLFLLPPYQPYQNDLPPAYSLCE
ncbi:hypothetical protein IWW50_007075, partial [Coemansia erecta]